MRVCDLFDFFTVSSEFEAGMFERVVVVQALGVVERTGPARRLGGVVVEGGGVLKVVS